MKTLMLRRFGAVKSHALTQAPTTKARHLLLNVSLIMCALTYATTSASGQHAMTTQQETLNEFKACYGSDWKHQVSPETGLVSSMMGGRIELSGALEDPVATAQRFLEANQTLLGFDRPEDTLEFYKRSGLSNGKGQVVSFNQLYKNVPVWQHRALVYFTEEGVLTYLSSGLWPIGDIDVKPRITPEQAERIIARSEGDEDVKANMPAELVLLARGEGVLAWHSISDVGSPQRPVRHFVDAKSGALIERAELSHSSHGPPKRRVSVKAEEEEPPLQLGAIDPCNKNWVWTAPAENDIVFDKVFPLGDPYAVDIKVGATSWDATEDATQTLAVYQAALALLPGIPWSIDIDWSIWTWDSYREQIKTETGEIERGHWDVFFTTLNSFDTFLALTDGGPIAERSCDFEWEHFNTIGPGLLLTVGGSDWGDENLCTQSSTDTLGYTEGNLNSSVVLSLGLDTGRTGETDGYFPSWGEFKVRITAPSHYFNPNPMAVLNNPDLVDDFDSRAAVPIEGYSTLEGVLPNLNPRDPDYGYRLQGEYCSITELGEPYIGEPSSHDGQFPYLRSCDQFEAVNCYIHITQFQLYLQSLGYTGTNSINARPIRVDPHYGYKENSRYVADGNGTGVLVFGDGGVDDAEDGDVIIHEYAHACLDNRLPGWADGAERNLPLTVNETRAIDEGCADFFAAHYFNSPAFAEWATEDLQGLRRCDLDWVYPQDLLVWVNGQFISRDDHDASQLFSSFLWDLRGRIGGDRTVKLIIDALAHMPDVNHYFSNMVFYMSVVSFNTGPAWEVEEITNAALDRGILRAIEISAVDAAGNPLPGIVDAIPTNDWRGRGGGTVPLERIYAWGRQISITAPATDADGRTLTAWRVNDGPWENHGLTTVPYRIDENAQHHVQIQYSCPAPFSFSQTDCVNIPGDLNGDGSVNGTDLAILLGSWGTPMGDIDGDGTTNGVDLSLLLGNWESQGN